MIYYLNGNICTKSRVYRDMGWIAGTEHKIKTMGWIWKVRAEIPALPFIA